MDAAGKHEPTRKHLRWFDPRQHCFARVFSQFKPKWSLGLALDDRYTFPDAVIFDEIRNGQFNQITATQIAVDSGVEHSQIARKFEPGPDRPDLSCQQRPFLTGDPPLFQALRLGVIAGR